MPLSRAALALLPLLALGACQNENEAADEPAATDEGAALDALESDAPRPADSTSLGDALSTSPEEIGEGYEPANTQNAEQQGVQPPAPAE